MAGGGTTPASGPDADARFAGLRRFNLAMGMLHLLQGVAVLVLSTPFALPVTAAYLRVNPMGGGLVPSPRVLFEVPIGPMVAVFFFLSAAAHLTVASPWVFPWYRRSVSERINPARWVEYSVSSSLMIVVVAMLVGIYDVASLLLLFALNASMILFGWVMELHSRSTGRAEWTAFWFGVFAGAVPWVAIGLYLFGSGGPEGGPPGFVYGIYLSIFLFFNVFALNMALQARARGRWRDYLFGERVFILLSLVAKSLLAWQVFAGTLRPA